MGRAPEVGAATNSRRSWQCRYGRGSEGRKPGAGRGDADLQGGRRLTQQGGDGRPGTPSLPALLPRPPAGAGAPRGTPGNVRNPESTLGHCVLPAGRAVIYKNSGGLAGIGAVRSRRPGALEFLQKNFAYQATYFPSHQFDQGQDEKYAKKQRNKNTPGGLR